MHFFQSTVPDWTLEELQEVKHNCQFADNLYRGLVMCVKVESNPRWLSIHILDEETKILLEKRLPEFVGEVLVVCTMDV